MTGECAQNIFAALKNKGILAYMTSSYVHDLKNYPISYKSFIRQYQKI